MNHQLSWEEACVHTTSVTNALTHIFTYTLTCNPTVESFYMRERQTLHFLKSKKDTPHPTPPHPPNSNHTLMIVATVFRTRIWSYSQGWISKRFSARLVSLQSSKALTSLLSLAALPSAWTKRVRS